MKARVEQLQAAFEHPLGQHPGYHLDDSILDYLASLRLRIGSGSYSPWGQGFHQKKSSTQRHHHALIDFKISHSEEELVGVTWLWPEKGRKSVRPNSGKQAPRQQ